MRDSCGLGSAAIQLGYEFCDRARRILCHKTTFSDNLKAVAAFGLLPPRYESSLFPRMRSNRAWDTDTCFSRVGRIKSI